MLYLVGNSLLELKQLLGMCGRLTVHSNVTVNIIRATLPPSTLFADRALLRREYSISEPNTLVETVSKYKGLH